MRTWRWGTLLFRPRVLRKSVIFTAKRSVSILAPSSQTCAKFGFLFDVDGVFVRGQRPLPAAAQALNRLVDSKGRFRVPTVFVTNAGNALRREKAQSLSELFGVKVEAEQVIMAHSPLRMFKQYHDKHFLVSGQGPAAEIAQSVGFTNIMTVDELRDRFPMLDFVDMRRRGKEQLIFEQDFVTIEGVLLLGEPVNWETSLQLVLDILMTDGQPTHRPVEVPRPHLPVLSCNMDLLWMAEAPLPRFGHGCFLLCLESLYKKLTGEDLQYTALVGKPSEATYHHAEYCLTQQAQVMGTRAGNRISRIYAIGDNPDTDVFGANLYDAYLQRKSRSRLSKVVTEDGSQLEIHTALTAGATSEIAKLVHHKPVTHDVQEDVQDLLTSERDEDFVETCISILVESGVYSAVHAETQSKKKNISHQHRDFDSHLRMSEDLRQPRFVCKNILEAVDLCFELERFPASLVC